MILAISAEQTLLGHLVISCDLSRAYSLSALGHLLQSQPSTSSPGPVRSLAISGEHTLPGPCVISCDLSRAHPLRAPWDPCDLSRAHTQWALCDLLRSQPSILSQRPGRSLAISAKHALPGPRAISCDLSRAHPPRALCDLLRSQPNTPSPGTLPSLAISAEHTFPGPHAISCLGKADCCTVRGGESQFFSKAPSPLVYCPLPTFRS